MKITVVGRQMNVRESMKALVEKKLSKFDKFFADTAEATVKFSRVRDQNRLEITILSDGTIFRCEKEAATFENALDDCVDAIVRQIRKNKTRLERRLRTGAFAPENFAAGADTTEDDNALIRQKTFRIKPMTPDEAILQMNLLGHNFFVFRDSTNETTCVVYRRNDGGYGLLVPEP